VDGLARPRLTPGPSAAVAVATVVTGSAAVLGVVAVYSPKDAALALLAIAFVVVAMSRLPLAVAAFIVLTFPAHLPGSFGAGATLAKPVGALLVLAWAGLVLTRRARLPLLPQSRPLLFAALVGFLLFGCASILWATDSGQTTTGVERYLLNAALLVVIYTAASTRSGFRTIVNGFLLGSAITSLYGIVTGGYNQSTGRLAGIVNSDYFASEVIPAIIIACILLVTARSPRMRWVYAAVAVADLAGFVLTQSRGGIVGLAVGLLALVALAGRARPRVLALVLVLVAVGVGYYFGYKPAHVFSSGQRGGSGLNSASSGRVDEWRVALRVFEGHPLGGVGVGNFPVVEPSYATQTFNLEFSRAVVKQQLVAHNTYLELAAELGLVGLILFLAILAVPLRVAWRVLAKQRRKLDGLEFSACGLLAGTIGMLAGYFFLSAEFEKPLWIVLALLAAAPMLLRDDTPDEGTPA
jgi:putative inorganic carbon (hco3(-)) transporter